VHAITALLASLHPTGIRFTKSLLRIVTAQPLVDGPTLHIVGKHDLTYGKITHPMMILV
jgi:hypothetical protein